MSILSHLAFDAYPMPDFLHALPTWLASHPQWLGLGIALIALLECTALIGVLWPGVVLLFSISLLAGQSGMALWPLFLLCWSGTLLGNLGSFALGLRLQNNTRKLPLLRKHPQWLSQAQLQLNHYGSASLFLGHFIGPVRPVLPLLAGMLQLRWRTFAGIILPTTALWSFTSVLPGWLVGTALEHSPPEGFWLRAAVASLPALLLGLVGWSLVRNQHPQRHLLLTGLSLLAMLPLLLAWPWLQAMDSYLSSSLLALRPMPLDQLALILTQLGDVRLQFLLHALLCATLLFYRNRQALYFAICSLAGPVLLSGLLKLLLARPRPAVLETLDGFSLPSGHSVRAAALLFTLAALASLGRSIRARQLLALLALGMAALVALSRVYLAAHWPSDTLAGLLLSSLVCWASLAFWQRRQPLTALPDRALRDYLLFALLSYGLFVLLTLDSVSQKYQLPW